MGFHWGYIIYIYCEMTATYKEILIKQILW